MIKLKNILSEGKYYVTYNKGGGKGKGLMGGEFKTYKDAAKYAKDAASPISMTAYWVSDKNMNRLTEGVPMPMDTPNEFAYLEFKKWAYKKRGKIKKQMLSLKDDGGKMFRAMELVWQTWAKSTNNKAYTKVKNPSKFGRALIVMMWKDNLIFNKNTNKITRLKETIDLRKIFMKGRKKKRTTDEGKITERLAKGLKPLLKLGSTITKKAGEAALIKLSDKFDRIDDEYAGEIASWLDMAIELMQDGYAGDATKKLKQFNQKCKDVLKGKSIKSAFAEGVNEAEYGTPTGTKTLKSIDAKFDDEVFKKPPHRIDKAWVLKIAKKHKVDIKKAIEWVNLNPKINIKEANYKYFRTYLGKLADEMGDHELLQIATNGSESKLKQYFKRDTDYEKFTDREVKSLSGKKLHNLLKYDKRWNEGKVNEGKRREIQFAAIGHNIVKKVVKNLKPGRDYDFGVGQGGMVLIDIDVKYLDQLVSVLNHKRIRWGIV